ncbi:penicillin-binding protein activator [Stutzerimonas nitrititolerans]|uniref:penicillin-binding protein activator n=1 Tax=Stutzerimonas nitrititolerans TaxID=2482751 RepID=UPI001BDBFCDD|nr:penicillin-binding protein activator [Stutzerimonas nitrititolerans]MBT1121864.1 penicillin-binding protein activator [Stutzerimonas nitrititolerans]
MPARLRPIILICLAALLAACASSPTSTLGELPRTPQATTQQLLEQADSSDPQKAALLRLAAADQGFQQGDLTKSREILALVPLEQLPPAQQIFASTLRAELALAANDPQQALQALQHVAFERLGELPVEQQVRSQLVRAKALETSDQPLAAARERIFIAPLLSGEEARSNHETIWRLVSGLPVTTPQDSTDPDLSGWLALARSVKQAGTLGQQQRAIDNWVQQNPQHPAAQQLPEPLVMLRELADRPLTHVALLLPMDGPLAGVARALRDGFLAAHLQAHPEGSELQIELYDSTRLGSLDTFYRQAQAAGVQLVVGPLEKNLVRQLSEKDELPITTLALNYSDAGQTTPPQLFQFGLAAEDEAREVARRAWADGHRRAIALTPRGEWGARVLDAFRRSWEEAGGTLVAAQALAEPVEMANQIASILQIRNGESRSQSTGGSATQPTRRQDVDFLFLAATPQQAQQVKPTLIFQYAGDLPVYATSHLHAANENRSQYLDLEGIRFAETPWLLDPQLPLRRQVERQWPQAGGSLGRLYAMGADAYLLAPRLNQLLALPDTQLEGMSGVLTLNPAQRIERQLPWAEFQDGEVRSLTDYPVE